MRGVEPAFVIACGLLAGCDGVFGLQHVYKPADAPPGDVRDAPGTGCLPATGNFTTKLFGGRANGVLAGGVTDTFLSSDLLHRDSNFGALDRLFACYQCQCSMDCESIANDDDDVVSLIRFDLGTEIPTCSDVQSVMLYLHTTGDNLGGGSSVVINPVLEVWDEGPGVLAGGVTGTASWNARTIGRPWTTPGAGAPGSRSTAMLGQFAPNATETDYAVPLDTGLVQIWVDDPTKNAGMALTVVGSTSDVHFYSSEATTPSLRPALQITYRPP